jgi:hypothetical protein
MPVAKKRHMLYFYNTIDTLPHGLAVTSNFLLSWYGSIIQKSTKKTTPFVKKVEKVLSD